MKFQLSMLSLVLSISLLLIGCDEKTNQAPNARPAQQVDVLRLTTSTVNFKQALPGRAVASGVAQVRPQVSGIVLKRHFEEGALVKAGEALYQIDDAISQASLFSAKAKILQTNTNLKNAKAQLTRYQALIKDKAVSQQQLDQSIANYDAYNAQLAMDKAALNRVEVDISYSQVLAPISGRISKSNVTEGALVTALQAQAMATITQLDPIYFDVVQANSQLRDIIERKNSGELTSVTQTAQLNFDGSHHYQHSGLLKFNEVQANPSTDTVTMRVEFPNPEYLLLPGMYGQVELVQATRANSILVPQKAVQFNHQGQASVFMLGKDNVVEARIIKVGRSFGANWLVLDGISAGEQLITAGLQKIAPGMTVAPVTKKAG